MILRDVVLLVIASVTVEMSFESTGGLLIVVTGVWISKHTYIPATPAQRERQTSFCWHTESISHWNGSRCGDVWKQEEVSKLVVSLQRVITHEHGLTVHLREPAYAS